MKRSRLSIKKESQILIMPLPTTIEAMLSIHGAFRLCLLNKPSSSLPIELR